MASPEKAVCDKIIATSGVFLRSTKQAFEFLTGDLRMEESQLGSLDTDTIESWLPEAPKKTSLQTMIKTLRTL
ncbi:hypothetical protein [Niabella ginsengisoli]|uniref:Uncharacterized protein n=1 Tax=Niabella ginsengisoli TaxID=522298 RepID=A0ABS9SHZ6_9BACT|nr:hypothetical protein [Niabella ginsengisoli]MCH5597991.1 hypothetical protein [Niabella ginsengisoli]